MVSIRYGYDSSSLSAGRPRPDDSGVAWTTQEPRQPCSASHACLSQCTSPAPIPTNLHVCRESRREALRRYSLYFGTAGRQGCIFFDPARDVLYFGLRDGFMASEAQLRTVLTLCAPSELAMVQRIAVNYAMFWVYGSASGSRDGQEGSSETGPRGTEESGRAPALLQTTIASSLLVDALQLVHARLPGLRELVFVPRDENPVYSGDCHLVEPAMVQSRLARQVREAMRVAFDGSVAPGGGGVVPWTWRIMALCADPDPPVYGRAVLGWEQYDRAGSDAVSDGSGRRGTLGRGVDVRAERKREAVGDVTRLDVLQEDVRRRLKQMQVDMYGRQA